RRFSASPGRRVSLRGLTKRVWSRRPGGSQRTAGGENLAEGMHPALRVLSRASSPAAELVELIEACQLDLELQSRAATLAACKRHQKAGVQAIAECRLDLLAGEVDALLTVAGQQVVGKAS